MTRDRVSVDMEDGDLHDEPFITTADHIKSRQDKSHMPDPSEDRSSDRDRRDQRRTRSQRTRSQTTASSRSSERAERSGRKADESGQQKPTTPDGLTEDEVVQRLVKRLRKKGVSQDFIDENMDRIREKARQELL